ncbi:MAG: copper amine oxidase N-terminal domain-containing protein [Fimbriimonas sp.]
MLPALFVLATAQIPAGTSQLVATPDRPQAAVNGEAIAYTFPPRLIAGKTMVPLVETVTFLGLPYNLSNGTLTTGRLTVGTDLKTAALDGQPLPTLGNFENRENTIYIAARLLADAHGGKFRAGQNGEFVITTNRSRDEDPSLPQPRFRTDKDTYAQGEPVVFQDYSFDPTGIISRISYSNRQPAYFAPGEVTVTLQVWNDGGKTNSTRRTIRITDEVMNTPLQFGLKYAAIGDLLPIDSRPLPVLPRLDAASEGPTLLFSDSPEQVREDGLLYRDTVEGPFRFVGYHLNAKATPGRLVAVVKNVDVKPAKVKVDRAGETAPARVEGVLGQVTLMDYFASRPGTQIDLAPGEAAVLYLSPTIVPQSGVSLLADATTDAKLEVSLAFTGELSPTPEAILALPALAPDTNHVRGTFPQAIRKFALDLAEGLPAKAVIGDPAQDPPAAGRDVLTPLDVQLRGNYGITYDVALRNAAGVTLAISPRGGLYKGVVRIEEEGFTPLLVPLPKSGNIATPDRPLLFHRTRSRNVRLLFVPASGSHLPVHLLFFRP